MEKISLLKLLGDKCGTIKIIDVGAMIVKGILPPYQKLLDSAIVIGFEPNENECHNLNFVMGERHKFFPYVIGDGSEKTFYTCDPAFNSSCYEPNFEFLDKFTNLAEVFKVTDQTQKQTIRLDDIEETKGADYLKIDVQGSEVDVFNGADKLLDEITVVHTEVCFASLYKNQPLFAEIDQHLRNKGFLFHKFTSIVQGRSLKPLWIVGSVNKQISQALWCDVLYVKNLLQFDKISSDKLLKLAVILSDVYYSYDLVHYILSHYDLQTNSDLSKQYLELLGKGRNGKTT